MTSFLEQAAALSPKRLALLAAELKERLDAAQSAARAPVAVVGMACRFPGAPNVERFWELLREGREAVRDVPDARWSNDTYFDADPDAPGTISSRRAALLDDIDRFDPEFFHIAPREALTMDPQQRLILEVAWEALEHAGIAPTSVAGSATGVFVGISGNDYQLRVLGQGAEAIDAYVASGNAHSVASGRLAYVLGLQGPALSIDTACSASLVALHVAAQSLRSGDCAMAIAGGVNVMCAPEASVAASRAHMLAADGRCKTFDASGDGYVRGEGCGLVVLKRLADAHRDGDRVLAVIAGSAINQDGRSSGLTVPNGPAQEAVLRAALAAAGVAPADIDYVEAHGTGTSLGDPIEVHALGNVLGDGRATDAPVLVGSVKTNVGHLESAAGVAGVIKVLLALEHEAIPPHLNFREPNPLIDWQSMPVRVATQLTPWRRGSRVRRAGVSSFGFSGTNAHLVLEEAPEASTRAAASLTVVDRPVHVMPLSARSETALRALATSYGEALDGDTLAGTPLADVAHTAAVGRAPFMTRAAIVAATAEEARAALRSFGSASTHPSVRRGVVRGASAPEVVFLYTGSGAQYPRMGHALYEAAPVYRDVIDRCDAALGADAHGRTLKSVLLGAAVHDMSWTQPALFALELALTALWRSWGVRPAAVIGHSTGEYAAACAAGVFSLEDGLRLVAERGRLLEALPAGGAMATIAAPPGDVAAALEPFDGRVVIASYNAPDSVVVSGESHAVDQLVAMLAARGVDTQTVLVPVAAHSPLVDPALSAMRRCAAAVAMAAPTVPVAWNLGADGPPEGVAPDADYWTRHMREPVRFASGISALHARGFRVFIEMGPHPTLLAMAQAGVPPEGGVFVPSLRRGHDDWRTVMTGLADLYVQGVDIDWTAFDRPYSRRRVALPTYPFERRRFWIDHASLDRAPAARRRAASTWHGRRLPTAEAIVETTLAPNSPAWLGDHRVHGAVVVPGPVYLELAHAALREVDGRGAPMTLEFVVVEAAVLPEEGRQLQVHLGAAEDGVVPFRIHGRPCQHGAAWTLHATGRLAIATREGRVAEALPWSDIASRLEALEPADEYYDHLAQGGLTCGPAFRAIERCRGGAGEAWAVLSLPAPLVKERIVWSHPALVDAALQAVGLARPGASDDDATHLLTRIGRLTLPAPLPARCLAHVRIEPPAPDAATDIGASVSLFALDGTPVGSLDGVVFRRLTVSAGTAPHAFHLTWQEASDDAADFSPPPGRCLIVDGEAGAGTDMAASLRAQGTSCEVVSMADIGAMSATQLAAKLDARPEGTAAWLIDASVAHATSAAGDVPTAAFLRYQRHLALAQALDRASPTAGLCLVTRGAHRVRLDDVVVVEDTAALGLSRTVGTERMGPAARLDLDPHAPPRASDVLAALCGPDPEVAIRADRRFVPRLTAVPAGTEVMAIRRDGVYLVTGGSGALGRFVAEWLAARGAGEIVLASRTAAAPPIVDGIRRRGGAETRVRAVAVDLGDPAASMALRDELSRGASLRGIVHAAGLLDDAPLHAQSSTRFQTVARAKVEGAWHLHRLFADVPLDFFAVFSSASGLFGTPGQANYAAANAFLDGLAHSRRALGLPATSLAWGPWDDGAGMGGSAGAARQRQWHQQGIGLMAPTDALASLESALAGEAAYVTVMAMNPARFASRALPALRRLIGASTRSVVVGVDAPRRVTDELRHLSDATTETRLGVVRRAVHRHAARVLGLTSAALDETSSLSTYGLDSLMAVQLRNAIQLEAGVTLPVSQLLRRPSVSYLSELIIAEIDAHLGVHTSEDPRVHDWEEGSL